MSELARPLGVGRAAGTAPGEGTLARALSVRLSVTWEAAAWAALLVAGFGFRFWDLGSRALHHDESLHGYYAYQLYLGHGYEHTPLMHGPFQFFGTALTFFLAGGASDYTVRILPALLGTVLVGLPLLFRSHLGRGGALAAAALIAFSPTLLYYSRFAREDIYIAVFSVALVICLWRYVAEEKSRYLYLAAGLLALSFATKENTYITTGILLAFLNLWVASDLMRQTRERLGLGRARAALLYALLYLPFGWALTAVWPFAKRLRRRLGLEQRHPAMDLLLVVGTLAAPQFAAAIQLPIEAISGEIINTPAEERLLGVPTVLSLLAATALVGLRWNWRGWAIAAACFYVPYTLLYTSFLTNIDGFGSGMWESLDYWMGQHGARRGDQPEFYYLMFYPAYEFVALAFGGPALLYHCLRGGQRSCLLIAITLLALLAFFGGDSFANDVAGVSTQGLAFVALPVAAVALFFAVRGTMFERFLVFWTAAAIVAYSFVGEKMPWLSVHTSLPMIILAAYTLGKIISQRPEGIGDHVRPYLAPIAAAACSALAVGVAVFGPEDGVWLVLRVGVAALGLVAVVALLVRSGRGRFAVVASAVVLGSLGLLSVRVAVLATYDHGDVPREFLQYTQTSPDVPGIVEEIDRLAVTSGQGHDLRVQVDSVYSWPWAWYLRDYNATYEPVDAEFRPESGAILLIAAPNEIFTGPYRDGYEPARRYVLRWWFPEEYRGIGEKDNLAQAAWDFLLDLGQGDTWQRWWSYFVDRDVTPRGVEGRAYFPLASGPLAPAPPVAHEEPPIRPTADLEGRFVIGRAGSQPGEMQGPVGVALDGAGGIYVADSGNARIQKFDARGALVASAGTAGGEPGQFNQPADLALDAAGNVYVADTWNHRIQKFGPDLSLIATWGKPTRDLVNPGPDEMWGPRGIAIDGAGNVWVTDTGTHRVRKFAADGTPLGAFGKRGKGQGEFQEPVGIAVGPDGSIYVADAGNARIQKFDGGFAFLAAYAIADWADLSPRNKPYLAALPDGRLLATDGPHGRLLLIDQEGKVTAHLDTVAEVPLFFPAGVAFDAANAFVYLTDALAGHVRRFPFTDFALR